MPVPTGYTEATFKEWLHQQLASNATVAQVLGWDGTASAYDDVTTDALLALGLTDITTVTATAGIRQLRAAGRVLLWRAALAGLATAYTFSNSNGSYQRRQMSELVSALLVQAENEAAACGATGVLQTAPPVEVGPVAYPLDPYAAGGYSSLPWGRWPRRRS